MAHDPSSSPSLPDALPTPPTAAGHTVLDDRAIRRALMRIAHEIVERYTAETRCTHLCMWMQMAGMPAAKAQRSMELFAKEVMPHFRR